RLDRRVDVEVHVIVRAQTLAIETLLRHQRLELLERLLVEAVQIAIQRVDARNDSSREPHEQRIGRQGLDAEHARLARRVRVDEEPQLSVLRDYGAAVRLERAELTKSAVDPLFAQERTEPRKSGHRGQRFVRGPEPDARWIWPADAVAPAGRALAAHDVSTHLRGARRVGGR